MSNQDHAVLETYEALWQTLQVPEDTLRCAYDMTILPRPVTMDPESHLASLPLLTQREEGEPSELSLGKPLGSGGMGLVLEAVQVPLGRDVAVKKVRPERESKTATVRLLQEAWCTGLLEHPNIVPVYLLGVDGSGAPMLVMKKIEGTSWRDIIHDKAQVPQMHQERYERDPLGWHLEILIRMCTALQFAHSRGVIHRDLKPENVMIGAFGEVYLLDWGIAVGLHQEHEGRLPMANKSKELVGTPAYMSPEMAAGEKGVVGIWTDIYLLGATLHEVLTGAPPHSGDSLFQVMFHAFCSTPYEYGPKVPTELAALCHKAMHHTAEHRFADVASFRQAIDTFLLHRSSQQLSDEAGVRLGLLQERMERAQEEDDESAPFEISRLFGESRFGFEQALRKWPENAQAQAGLQESLEAMAVWEITQGHQQAAAVLLAELERANPDLEERLEELAAKQAETAEQLEELKRIQRELDPQLGVGQRSYLALLLALIWGLYPIIALVLESYKYHRMGYGSHIMCALLFIGEVVCGAVIWRRTLLQNRINRQIMSMALMTGIGLLLLWLAAVALRLAIPQGMLLTNLVFFMVSSMTAITVDRRLLGAATIHLLALFAGMFWMKYVFWISALGNTLSFTLTALFWNPFVKQIVAVPEQHIRSKLLALKELHDQVKEHAQSVLESRSES